MNLRTPSTSTPQSKTLLIGEAFGLYSLAFCDKFAAPPRVFLLWPMLVLLFVS
eukprot:m.430529 g.430529  ORF g.430529 m.430529 type:complete len:53 (-) comp56727_c0_seq15:114-272(-)